MKGRERMRSRRSRQGALILFVAMAVALAACGRQSPAPVTEEPYPPSWFVGEEDRTTPAPTPPALQAREASLAVGDSAFQPATLVVKTGSAVRIENTGTRIQSFIVDGVDMATVEPGASKVVSIDLGPGRYAFSSGEDPSITGTLVVT
jgi:plastocyanin